MQGLYSNCCLSWWLKINLNKWRYKIVSKKLKNHLEIAFLDTSLIGMCFLKARVSPIPTYPTMFPVQICGMHIHFYNKCFPQSRQKNQFLELSCLSCWDLNSSQERQTREMEHMGMCRDAWLTADGLAQGCHDLPHRQNESHLQDAAMVAFSEYRCHGNFPRQHLEWPLKSCHTILLRGTLKLQRRFI